MGGIAGSEMRRRRRRLLHSLQGGHCFWCGMPLSLDAPHFDEAMMHKCDALLLVAHLDGWEDSKGIAHRAPASLRLELAQLLRAAVSAFESLSPEQQAVHLAEQRRSWVIGELMLSNPSLTRDEATQIYERACRGLSAETK